MGVDVGVEVAAGGGISVGVGVEVGVGPVVPVVPWVEGPAQEVFNPKEIAVSPTATMTKATNTRGNRLWVDVDTIHSSLNSRRNQLTPLTGIVPSLSVVLYRVYQWAYGKVKNKST